MNEGELVWRMFWTLNGAISNIWGRRFNTIWNAAISLGSYSLLVTESEQKIHNKRLKGDTFRVAPGVP